MIPGLVHGLVGGVPVVELELVGVGASGNANSVSYSHTPQAGDMAIFIDSAYSSSIDVEYAPSTPPAASSPSGFTDFVNDTNYFTWIGRDYAGRLIVFGRVCDGSEGSTVWGMTQGNRRKVLALFRPSVPVTFDADVTGSNLAKGNGSTSNTLPVSLSARSLAPVLNIVAYQYGQNTSIAITGMPSLTSLDSGQTGHRTAFACQQLPAELATQDAALAQSRSNHIIGAILGLRLRP